MSTSLQPRCGLLRLPAEIRHRILELTDLVTPLREINWQPCSKYFYHSPREVHPPAEGCDPRESTLVNHIASMQTYCRDWLRQDGCTCGRCWSPPCALFLVCRTLLHDAQHVLFRNNRFVVRAENFYGVKSTPPQVAPSIILQSLAPSALASIRHLEIVFPPFDHDFMRAHEPAYADWLRTIDYISDKLTLTLLTIRIVMADHREDGDGVTRFRFDISRSQAEIVLEAYSRIISPLKKLANLGLRRFFVNAAIPWMWRNAFPKFSPLGYRTLAGQPIELGLEQEVMGSNYDGRLLGKLEELKSQWIMVGICCAMWSNNYYPEDIPLTVEEWKFLEQKLYIDRLPIPDRLLSDMRGDITDTDI